MRPASDADVPHLVRMMGDFYAEAAYPFDAARAEATFARLLGDETLGAVWLIESGTEIAGYLIVTLGFSLEYGGRDAFVDDLYVRTEFRGSGLGTAAIGEARRYCESAGVRALHLEVERDNTQAQRIYRKAGFEGTERRLLTLRLR